MKAHEFDMVSWFEVPKAALKFCGAHRVPKAEFKIDKLESEVSSANLSMKGRK